MGRGSTIPTHQPVLFPEAPPVFPVVMAVRWFFKSGSSGLPWGRAPSVSRATGLACRVCGAVADTAAGANVTSRREVEGIVGVVPWMLERPADSRRLRGAIGEFDPIVREERKGGLLWKLNA